MRAMILAAGRGERMRPLSDRCPKPLLPVAGKPLIVWQLEALAAAGFRDVVINHAHLGEMFEQTLGDGAQWGLRIRYSPEQPALETAGGIARALPMLGHEPFLVTSGDLFSDFPFERARAIVQQMRASALLAWCVLVPNPPHHPQGDFALVDGRLVDDAQWPKLNFAGIGIYMPGLFAGLRDDAPAKLGPLLREAARAGRCGGERHDGVWINVGTPGQLEALDAQLRSR
jgi:MurNAc alpha-1-phosphate uridylyltransferase